jgi:hypothetical protein
MDVGLNSASCVIELLGGWRDLLPHAEPKASGCQNGLGFPRDEKTARNKAQ